MDKNKPKKLTAFFLTLVLTAIVFVIYIKKSWQRNNKNNLTKH